MDATKRHYDIHLAERYTWAFGGHELNQENNSKLFAEIGLQPAATANALDLGAGSGFQTIPLLELGFNVRAVDLCEQLLKEIRDQWPGPELETIVADVRDIKQFADRSYDVVLCMGDTIAHLASPDEAKRLIADTRAVLNPGGTFVVSFRDLSAALIGTDRFIPVRSDSDRIFTCFLEYNEDTVKVNDIIYERDGDGWNLHKSAYTKIKVPKPWVVRTLEASGFTIVHEIETRGMHTIAAEA